ncbi:MAG: DEAD/DEAH box helicase family protein [Gemmatimonadota bacterium]
MLTFSPPSWPGCTPRRWQEEAFAATVAHMGFMAAEPAVVSAIMGAGKSLLVAELAACVELPRNQTVVVSTSTEHLVEDLSQSIGRRCRMNRHVGVWYGRRKRMGDVVVACTPSVPALAGELRARGLGVALWIADEAHRTECSTILDAHHVLDPAHTLGVTATAFRADKWETMSLFKKLIYRYGVAQAQADGVVVPWRIVHSPEGGDLDATCLALAREAVGPGVANAVDIEDAKAFAALLTGAGIPAQAVHSLLHPRQRRKILEDLARGRLRCVVHVNMLSEGVNFPWLRWMLLRRQVESKVRFMQEAGRMLRSSPGKTEATFYDVHDLFGSFQLSYAEALGEPPEKPESDTNADPLLAARHIEGEQDPAVALRWIESIIRTLVVACDTAGILVDRKMIPKADRVTPSTPLQQAAMTSAVEATKDLIPAGWRGCLEAVCRRPESVRFGFAADLIVALEGVRRCRRWPPVDAEGRISAVPGELPSHSPRYIEGRGGQLHYDLAMMGG